MGQEGTWSQMPESRILDLLSLTMRLRADGLTSHFLQVPNGKRSHCISFLQLLQQIATDIFTGQELSLWFGGSGPAGSLIV